MGKTNHLENSPEPPRLPTLFFNPVRPTPLFRIPPMMFHNFVGSPMFYGAPNPFFPNPLPPPPVHPLSPMITMHMPESSISSNVKAELFKNRVKALLSPEADKESLLTPNQNQSSSYQTPEEIDAADDKTGTNCTDSQNKLRKDIRDRWKQFIGNVAILGDMARVELLSKVCEDVVEFVVQYADILRESIDSGHKQQQLNPKQVDLQQPQNEIVVKKPEPTPEDGKTESLESDFSPNTLYQRDVFNHGTSFTRGEDQDIPTIAPENATMSAYESNGARGLNFIDNIINQMETTNVGEQSSVTEEEYINAMEQVNNIMQSSVSSAGGGAFGNSFETTRLREFGRGPPEDDMIQSNFSSTGGGAFGSSFDTTRLREFGRDSPGFRSNANPSSSMSPESTTSDYSSSTHNAPSSISQNGVFSNAVAMRKEKEEENDEDDDEEIKRLALSYFKSVDTIFGL